jgi:hypothetical protein
LGVTPGALGGCKQECRKQRFCNVVEVEAYGVDRC